MFYANNATDKSYDTASGVAWIGQSVTPYTNLNAGFRYAYLSPASLPLPASLRILSLLALTSSSYYLVDPSTFQVLDSLNYYANVSNAAAFAQTGEVAWEFAYSARETYDPGHLNPPNTPLDGRFWHGVATEITLNETFFARYTDLRTKLKRPYANVTGVDRDRTLCGYVSSSLFLPRLLWRRLFGPRWQRSAASANGVQADERERPAV